MTFQPLSPLVREARANTPLPPLSREAAAAVALETWGERALALPALVNVAALALALPRDVVHDVSPGAARRADETDLHTLPDEPPTLLRRAALCEVRRPHRERLFGSTVSLGAYALDGAVYLVGLDWPDGVRVARWRPYWSGGDLPAGIPADASPLIDDVEEHREWAREAARWLLMLGLLLDAQGSPVREGEDVPVAVRRRSPTGNGDGPVTRRVYLDEPARPGGSSAVQGGPVEGRLGLEVPVKGHLKRQPYGPAQGLRRWVYVESYEARRWVAPRPLRIVVRERPGT